MANSKKESATSAAVKAAKPTPEPIKEKAAETEKKTVKPAADKKKATAPKKAAAKTSTAKKAAPAAAKAASTKTTAMTETKKTAPKTAKKSTTSKPAKKAAPVKSKKITAKRTAKGKADEVVIQNGEKDYTLSEIAQLCKDAYRGGTKKQIKSIKVYVKAEKNKLVAYYVVNDSVNGSVDL